VVLHCAVLRCTVLYALTSDSRFDQLLTPKSQREKREKGKCNALHVVRKEKRRGGERRKVERGEEEEKREEERGGKWREKRREDLRQKEIKEVGEQDD
jgi:hypothetical protein